MESITLRQAVDRDKALLFDLHERLFRDHIEEIWGWDTAHQVEYFEREWETSAVRIIEVKGVFAGAIQQREHDDHTFILNFAIDTPYQSQGIGSELIEKLKAEATSAGRALQLNVFRTNPRAREFYSRHGFTIHKNGENGWGMRWEASSA